MLDDRKTVVAVHVSGDAYAQKSYGCPIGSLGTMFGPYMRFFQGSGYTLRTSKYADGICIQLMDLHTYSTDYQPTC